MRAKLQDFAGGYATEAETAEEIRTLYEKTGYVLAYPYGSRFLRVSQMEGAEPSDGSGCNRIDGESV